MSKFIISLICLCLFFMTNIYSGEYVGAYVLNDSYYRGPSFKRIFAEGFEIENGKFVENSASVNYFNSISEFELIWWSGGDSDCRTYKYDSFLSLTGDIGIGSFWMRAYNKFKEYWMDKGNFLVGKPFKSADAIKTMSILSYDGYVVSDPKTLISVQLDAQTGIIHGTMGDFYIESSPQSIFFKYSAKDGIHDAMHAKLYSYKNDGTRKEEGELLLTLYGEEAEFLAGGFVQGKEILPGRFLGSGHGIKGGFVFLHLSK